MKKKWHEIRKILEFCISLDNSFFSLFKLNVNALAYSENTFRNKSSTFSLVSLFLFCLFTSKFPWCFKYLAKPLYNMGWEWHVLLVFFLVYVPGRLAACSLVGGQDFCKIIRIHNYKNGIVFLHVHCTLYMWRVSQNILLLIFLGEKTQRKEEEGRKSNFKANKIKDRKEYSEKRREIN